MPSIAYIALGSNVGDRRKNLADAIALLDAEPDIRVMKVATPIETDPVDCPPGSEPFVNSAAELSTDLEPLALLERLLAVEQQLGRRRSIQNAPRQIDLDLILFDNRILKTDALELPHPRMHERPFVLIPLAEIAPDAIHPVLNKSMRELHDVVI